MRSYLNSFEWPKSGLFWRTFFLLALLVMSSMAVWFASFRMVERAPRAQQIAAQISSIVTITRAALTHSAPDKRRELLFDLASNDGIRVYLLEETDDIESQDRTPAFEELRASVQKKLGTHTRFAKKMNGVDGFWVSFEIDDDRYWLRLDQERIEQATGIQVLGWAAITLFLTLIGAAIISKLINDPLARISVAARMLAKGKQPRPLPEKGPKEIRETNSSFNQMMEDLERIDLDRTIILAGISHDLRTPLARMQLEVEMANLSAESRQGMQSDLGQMDEIIGQFLDYAKPIDAATLNQIDLSDLLLRVIEEFSRLTDVQINSSILPDMWINGNAIELKRLFNNIIENARRYGKTSGTDLVNIDLHCEYKNKEKKQGFIISLRDYGNGVNEEDLIRLLRPFTRGDVSRSQANGSGLGLAIVEKITQQHDGTLRISNHSNGGFVVTIFL
ncbi:ATP-binding protein [Undibacterium sp. RTI2.2]|uniref:ATP-binding protein n=1 Tax=unclassified Undibacterium TaxID=2630295 RepID=UPI002AB56C36|nr:MULTISPECIES: ATP-binding protein [unclassified Undibacterium]MDY7537276.1 ATP-binding protein [Undibacterium sp. 5I1]MEB0117541.1 ATP-binding protein [Undibacterium sp. RTI2.2]MEB0230311.1 ATP-binding protein [Undibacterium sp. 10I3]MEB0258179.1 ATP-binding protein [Undibacterium sp. 5I1]